MWFVVQKYEKELHLIASIKPCLREYPYLLKDGNGVAFLMWEGASGEKTKNWLLNKLNLSLETRPALSGAV